MSSSSSKSQQSTSSQTANNDNRVAVTDNGIYAGYGSTVDSSEHYLDARDFSDHSQTTIQTTDARSFDSHDTTNNFDQRDFSDKSQTAIITTDARQTNDSRQYIDNSVHNDLDAEVVKSALGVVGTSIDRSADVMDKAFAASLSVEDRALNANAALAAKSIDATNAASASAIRAQTELANNSMTSVSQAYSKVADYSTNLFDKVLGYSRDLTEKAQDEAKRTEDFTTGFVRDFYKSQQSSDQQTSGELIKAGTAVAAVTLLVWMVKRK